MTKYPRKLFLAHLQVIVSLHFENSFNFVSDVKKFAYF